MNIKNIFKTKPIDLEKIYKENKNVFELFLIKDFVGYIPKDIQEPTLKCFKEYGEIFEKWTLWQSWYINTRAINDPLKIPFYQGMMVYLKVLNTMAKINKQNYQPTPKDKLDEKVVSSWVDDAINEINYFKTNVNKAETNQDTKSTEVKSTDKV